MTPAVFRPRRYTIVLSGVAVLLCLLFSVAGVACFYTVGLHPFSFAFTGLGAAAAATAVGSMFTRTILTADGIAKQPILSGGFRFRWEDVVSWDHVPRRSDDAPCVRFRVRGSRFPRVVFDYEVEQPGFESFLSYVRQHLSQKTAAEPGSGRQPRDGVTVSF